MVGRKRKRDSRFAAASRFHAVTPPSPAAITTMRARFAAIYTMMPLLFLSWKIILRHAVIAVIRHAIIDASIRRHAAARRHTDDDGFIGIEWFPFSLLRCSFTYSGGNNFSFSLWRILNSMSFQGREGGIRRRDCLGTETSTHHHHSSTIRQRIAGILLLHSPPIFLPLILFEYFIFISFSFILLFWEDWNWLIWNGF